MASAFVNMYFSVSTLVKNMAAGFMSQGCSSASKLNIQAFEVAADDFVRIYLGLSDKAFFFFGRFAFN